MKILGKVNRNKGKAILIGESCAPTTTDLNPFGSDKKVKKRRRIE